MILVIEDTLRGANSEGVRVDGIALSLRVCAKKVRWKEIIIIIITMKIIIIMKIKKTEGIFEEAMVLPR